MKYLTRQGVFALFMLGLLSSSLLTQRFGRCAFRASSDVYRSGWTAGNYELNALLNLREEIVPFHVQRYLGYFLFLLSTGQLLLVCFSPSASTQCPTQELNSQCTSIRRPGRNSDKSSSCIGCGRNTSDIIVMH